MEKYVVVYGCSGYDGDDDYCFGNAGLVAICGDRAEAERRAREEAEEIANDFFPPYPEGGDADYTREEWEKDRAEAIEIEDEYDEADEGNLAAIHITHNDEMFPHHGTVRIIRTEIQAVTTGWLFGFVLIVQFWILMAIIIIIVND